MIKRRFYRLEHSNKDNPSESASSSSDSEVQADGSDTEEIEMKDADEEESEPVLDSGEKAEASSSSGYESEGSSANEVNLDSSEFPASDDEKAAQTSIQGMLTSVSHYEEDVVPARASSFPDPLDAKDCVLKRKSVFKCKLCPRIVCLNEDTLKAHLNSKRHARSEKLYKAGRLKLMLNDDGKIEGEDYPKNHATSEGPRDQKKKGSNRRSQQRKRSRQIDGRD